MCMDYREQQLRRKLELDRMIKKLEETEEARSDDLEELLALAAIHHGPRTREYWVWYRDNEDLIVRLGGQPFSPDALPEKWPL